MENIGFQSYGNYASSNYGVNALQFFTSNLTYWFSYKTLVAFKKIGGELYVRENIWGVTTGKHLNWIDGGDKSSRLTAEEFEAKLKEAIN